MRYSVLLGKVQGVDFSVKEADTSLLLARAGFLRHTEDASVSLLPLGTRVLRRMESILESVLDKRGAQPIELPQLVRSQSLFTSGRYEIFDGDVLYFRNEKGEEFFQTGHYEENVIDFLKTFAVAENEFPICVYFYSNKIRPLWDQTGTALAAREYRALNIFSAHRNMIELNDFLPTLSAAFCRILNGWGIQVIYTESELHHSFGEKAFALTADMDGKGSDHFFFCSKCGYMARSHMAKSAHSSHVEELKPAQKIRIPKSCNTYEKLAEYLSVPDYAIIKCALFRTEKSFVMTVCRGDYIVSKEKLGHLSGGTYLRAATPTEAALFFPKGGFLSPVGLDSDDRVHVIVDESVVHGSNFVLGLNEEGFVLQNANFGVDFEGNETADISVVKEGDLCIQCGEPLQLRKESEVLRLVKTGDEYSKRMGFYATVRKKRQPVCLGSYTVDLMRLFFITADKARDRYGFGWPHGLEPFLVYLFNDGRTAEARELTELIYQSLPDEILLDDRVLSAMEKLQTARLTGIPYAVIVDDALLKKRRVRLWSRRTGRKREYAIDLLLKKFKNGNRTF